jgi:hypothetical protein
VEACPVATGVAGNTPPPTGRPGAGRRPVRDHPPRALNAVARPILACRPKQRAAAHLPVAPTRTISKSGHPIRHIF